MESIKLQIETERILKVLSNDIYDSPYALLRENIQNGFDAILMRLQEDNNFTPCIKVDIYESHIIISDNGIGMDNEILVNNYWKAGSSGKNTEYAKKAGVVGTFGIGAMANFGICTSLEIITKSNHSNETLYSKADRHTLSVTEDCIIIDNASEDRDEYGTTIIATLEKGVHININEAEEYLKTYVHFLDVPVLLNNKLISQNAYLTFPESENIIKENISIKDNNIEFQLAIYIQNFNEGLITCEANNIRINGVEISGDIALRQKLFNILGCRNKFGLSNIPVNSIFNLGGVVNLSILVPTAGREALSRESSAIVNSLISIIEKNIAETISKYSIADSNRDFLNYVSSYNRLDLTSNITIQSMPSDKKVNFEKLGSTPGKENIYFYLGSDRSIIDTYANENSELLIVSKENPRRNIQHRVLLEKKIEEIRDTPTVFNVINEKDLSFAEVAFILRLSTILKEDYLLEDIKVQFANISHGLPNMVNHVDGTVYIYLSQNSGNIQQVLKIYEQEIRFFESFVKDFVRNYLYPKISQYIPSSTKSGADELFKSLQKKKELYTIDYYDLGEIESLLQDYVKGDISMSEIIRLTSVNKNIQEQKVEHHQVGSVESVVTALETNNTENTNEEYTLNEYDAYPPILRREEETQCKILKTETDYPSLRNMKFFLALSDRLFNRNQEFFFEPHTTKIIWSMHKIIYIFTHISGNLTLYYDIELKEKLPNNLTGGTAIPSTTIITKNRIFVPIAPELISYFDIKQDSKEFYVRFDIIMQ
ncbi:ATP-binding protein [uncultured Parabacteroides sp.]|uniref:ATP-binding protein n=1 Tax=uncultured Parabacteroides sp. TaxID=512312 RepID=UPI0026102832|nr:ATP-binding protein [uncultured Parabacteroides sp.]